MFLQCSLTIRSNDVIQWRVFVQICAAQGSPAGNLRDWFLFWNDSGKKNRCFLDILGNLYYLHINHHQPTLNPPAGARPVTKPASPSGLRSRKEFHLAKLQRCQPTWLQDKGRLVVSGKSLNNRLSVWMEPTIELRCLDLPEFYG